MAEPIKAGDLVMVVRTPHVCSVGWLGHIYRVAYIHPLNPTCRVCGADLVPGAMTAIHSDGTFSGAPLPWLKRIPPLEELEGEKRGEEITA